MSLIAGGGPLSTVSSRPLSLVAGDGPSSAVSGRLLSPVPPAGSRALFLTSTPSCAHCFSLPSLLLFHYSLPSSLISLARNPTLLTGKRLFDQAFITQRPIASKRQQEELDLSFGQYSCSVTIKINRLWQSELYDPKPICLLKAISLLSFLFWDDSFIPYTRHIVLLAKKLGLTTRHVDNQAIKERIGAIWQNKTIIELNTLFAVNPNWWVNSAIIYAKPSAVAVAASRT